LLEGQARSSTLPGWEDIDVACECFSRNIIECSTICLNLSLSLSLSLNVTARHDYSRIMSGYSSPSISPLEQPQTTPMSSEKKVNRRGGGGEINTPFSANSKVSLESLAAEALDSTTKSEFNDSPPPEYDAAAANLYDGVEHAKVDKESSKIREHSPHYYGGDRAFWEHHRSGFKTVAERERDEYNKGSLPTNSVEPSYDVRAILKRHERIFSQQSSCTQLNQQEQRQQRPMYETGDIVVGGGNKRGNKIENITFRTLSNEMNENANEVDASHMRHTKEDQMKPAKTLDSASQKENHNLSAINIMDEVKTHHASSNEKNQSSTRIAETYRARKREEDIGIMNRQVAGACFDRSREAIAMSFKGASSTASAVVKDSVEAYTEWMIQLLKEATLALNALARDSTFSTDENSWGGSFGAEVASAGRHNPCASAWLKDLGNGLLNISNEEQQPQHNKVGVLKALIGEGIRFEGTPFPLTPGDGGGVGKFGSWGVTAPPPLIVSTHMSGLLKSNSNKQRTHGVVETSLNTKLEMPLPSIQESFPNDDSQSLEVVEWCSQHIVELMEYLSSTVESHEQLKCAKDARKSLESLCEAVGELTVACGSIVDRLQERDRLRRSQLRDSIQHMEKVAAQNARHLVLGERAARAVSIAALEKSAMMRAEESCKALENKIQEQCMITQKVQQERDELKQIQLTERNQHKEDLAQLKEENREIISEIEDSHEETLQELRKKFEETFASVQQSKEKEMEELRIGYEKQSAESRMELERQVNVWKDKATNAESRVKEAISGRAAAETRARDVLDREVDCY
jgi:hypothetical protein